MEFEVNAGSFPESQQVINIRRDRCDGCAMCIDVCPTKALSIIENRDRPGKHIVFVAPRLCHGCGLCQATCPKEALFLPGLSPDEIRKYLAMAIKEIQDTQTET
ncbi:MAG: 4Fe-4S dicluster domain-containing protein [Deltaproteobacteria bacterium]|nr:4Fe-4S dicluster domain-containing protein [Deltaproteobacteria bacterium]